MEIERRDFLKFIVMTVPLTVGANAANAQVTNIRIVVPFAAGSGLDTSARVFSEAMRLANPGITTIVENKGGGATVVGTLEVARSKPDGSTILYTSGGHTTNAALMNNLPYDSVTSFTPITLLTRSPGFGLIVSDKSPYKTLQEFVAAAKAKPGVLTYGSSGNGNTTHVVGALFARNAKIDMIHVPYKATPLPDLMAGTIDCLFVSPSLIIDHLQAGRMRMLGISSKARLPEFPDAVAFNEIGVEADVPAWSGFWGPAKLPKEVVQTLYDALSKAAKHQVYQEYNKKNGGLLVLMPPDEFAPYVAKEIDTLRNLLPSLGIKIE